MVALAALYLSVFASALSLSSGLAVLSKSSVAERGNSTLHVLLARALFDEKDHAARIQAIRETWGKDPQVRLQVLNFGVKHFEEQYHNWCTDLKNCPVRHEVVSGETAMPPDVMSSKLWNLDGHIWALRQALKDPTCEWIMLGQDMLYVHMPNLRNYIASFDHRKPLVLSNRLHGHLGTMGSPWGQILSRGAAQVLVDGWQQQGLRQKLWEGDAFLRKLGGMTDFGLGWALHKMEPPAEFVDTRNSRGEDRLYLWPPSRMEQNNWWDSWYPNMRAEKPKKVFAPEAFLFFFAGPSEIRALGAFFEHPGQLGNFLEAPEHKTSRSFYKESTWRMLDAARK